MCVNLVLFTDFFWAILSPCISIWNFRWDYIKSVEHLERITILTPLRLLIPEHERTSYLLKLFFVYCVLQTGIIIFSCYGFFFLCFVVCIFLPWNFLPTRSILSATKDSLNSFFPIRVPFTCFLCVQLSWLDPLVVMMLNRSKRCILVLFLCLEENIWFSMSCTLLALSFLWTVFTLLRKHPSSPDLDSVFIVKGYWIWSSAFSISLIWFCVFLLSPINIHFTPCALVPETWLGQQGHEERTDTCAEKLGPTGLYSALWWSGTNHAATQNFSVFIIHNTWVGGWGGGVAGLNRRRLWVSSLRQ